MMPGKSYMFVLQSRYLQIISIPINYCEEGIFYFEVVISDFVDFAIVTMLNKLEQLVLKA